MNYLLDVNVLIALAHQAHSEHERVSRWFRSVLSSTKLFATCSITELGFTRISVQTKLEPNVASAKETLAAMKKSSPVPFVLVADTLGVATLANYAKTPAQLTDTHLLQLSKIHNAQLVTLDKGIPHAHLIPL